MLKKTLQGPLQTGKRIAKITLLLIDYFIRFIFNSWTSIVNLTMLSQIITKNTNCSNTLEFYQKILT